jgi:glycerol-3-phosphate dehydrogenase
VVGVTCLNALVVHAAAYGDKAKVITRIAEDRKLGKRLVRGHPMIEAEVVYAVHNEFCEHPEDFIARRTRLAFVDTAAAEQALPKVRYQALCRRLL